MSNSKKDIAKRHQDLVKQIEHHNTQYYTLNEPTVSDAAYDKLLVKLRALEESHPELVTETSPTQKVSGKASNRLPKVKHLTPMLSLYTETDYSEVGAQSFVKRVNEALTGTSNVYIPDLLYCCELKFDGLGIDLVYEDGVLVRASTRGDGEYGEDVTQNARAMASIPASLQKGSWIVRDFPKVLEVRGEVLMPKSAFRCINQTLLSQGKKPYVNERAAAAGALRLLDPKVTAERGLIFYAYSVSTFTEDVHITRQSSWLVQLKDWGFPVYDLVRVVPDALGMMAYHDRVLELRDTLDFCIDGVVYKVDSLEAQKQLGYSGREPKWATAHKFQAETATTVVEAIDIQVGRTGKLTPVARLKPVSVGGVTISNVTLHNDAIIKALDIRVGDVVEVHRAGDVIPEIVSVLARDPSHTSPYVFPTTCPSCHSPVEKEEEEADYRCTGGLICPDQRKQAILHFAQRKAMNIVGLGDKLVDRLVDTGLVRSVVDLYHPNTFRKLLLGEAMTNNLLKAVEDSKQTTLPKFLYSLGIRHTGEGTSKRLVQRYGTLEGIRGASEAELETVKDIGPTVAKSVHTFFCDVRNNEIVDKLRSLGVTWSESTPESSEAFFPLQGLTFVITGASAGLSREALKELLESLGGTVSGSVTSHTSFLLAGNDAGSKLSKALELGIPVVELSHIQASLDDPVWYTMFRKN